MKHKDWKILKAGASSQVLNIEDRKNGNIKVKGGLCSLQGLSVRADGFGTLALYGNPGLQ